MNNLYIVSFFKAVCDACPGLALNVYETQRAKKVLTVEQHRAVYEATGCYIGVKANVDTVGRTPEGCTRLSKFINVWVSENKWNQLGPHGAIGSASALVYMNPRIILHMFHLVTQKKWDELAPWSSMLDRLINEGLAPFTAKGYTDTAYDRLMGVATGFLSMSIRSRGPYTSANEDDVRQLRAWMEAHTPELMDL